MASQRPRPFLWASWLPRLLVGDSSCAWSLWFQANYFYDKVPDNDMSDWLRQHTDWVKSLSAERTAAGEPTKVEGQNTFRLRRRSGLELKGKPDLIARAFDRTTVVEAKTGAHRDADVAQVKLYMACLPKFSAEFNAADLYGEVAYRDGHRVRIDPSDIGNDFKSTLQQWITEVESPVPPAKVPSIDNCRFCKISRESCPERVANDVEPVLIDDF